MVALVAAGLACASAPGPPAPGRGHVVGEVRLVPRDGVAPGGSGADAYGDRRLRDVALGDYSTPGFAVVYSDGPAPTGGAELTIHRGAVRSRLTPSQAALGSGGAIVLRNASDTEHVVSVPAASFVTRLAPGESAEVPVPAPGEVRVFLLDEPGVEARLFAAPGPYAVPTRSGDFALRDLTPGRHEVHVWHPRFPPITRSVEVAEGAVVRVDLSLGVGVEPADAR